MMKKLMAATAGLALIASSPATAGSSASSLSLSSAATAAAQGRSEEAPGRRNRTQFERFLPIGVVVVFTAVFIYFLLDAREDDDGNGSISV